MASKADAGGRFDWWRFTVTGGGFMLDQYNLFVIGTVLLTMEVAPGVGRPTAAEKSILPSVKLVGAIAGQLGFGAAADLVGRRRAFLGTLLLVVIGAYGSAASQPSFGVDTYAMLAVWQFVLGVGVGGEYPLSATVSRESGSGADALRVGLTFCMQGVGFLLGPAVFLVLLRLYPGTEGLAMVWRWALGVVVVPAAFLIWPRYALHETTDFTAARGHGQTKRSLCELLSASPGAWRRLAGTSLVWFLFDVCFYGNAILAPFVFRSFGLVGKASDSPVDQVHAATRGMLVVALLGLPGYAAALYFVRRVGLWALQVGGLLGCVLVFGILSVFGTAAQEPVVAVVLYGSTFFVSNCGPNFTTFVMPSMCFPTAARARCHGIAAASGKLGAALGVYHLAGILHTQGIQAVCFVCAMAAALGVIATLHLLPRDVESCCDADQELQGLPADEAATALLGSGA
eukprot:TRINITY_DN44202_c0_g1_i1.p1 TRINITY_DN44202_c0_g1~~TRINITY_DN44202_c0_g1_i1.p1  ORF type:complete len:457 (+),score=94.94 TRINITY_DN44202_c0_g1_i1:63-1433(+)